ncbi:MAG TPA: methyl-accepting chemotaxis protein [Thermoanaerobaculia bacterium]
MTSKPPEPPSHGAAVGWLLLVGLAAVGLALLAAAAARGGAPWILPAFVVLVVAALAAYAVLVDRPARRLAARLPGGALSARVLSAELVAAFAHLGAGDLVRAGERTRALPERMAEVFLAATRALATLAERIQDSSIEVASSADEVNRIASELASGSSEQAASVVEITAAMEELARTASQIAANAARQASLAERAEASGDAGSAAVDEAVAGVEEVQKRISGIAVRADTLGTRSKEIYRVLDLITEIADETHILSLNAAIEGASAGADGRRFAVVAEEVRRLAHRSQESVDSVRSLLDEFSGSIRATIVATEEGSKEAGRVLERSRSASSAIGSLRSAAGDTARVARQISLATQQQNAASDEVVMTLREVSQVVQRMTGGLKQLSSTADRLNRLGLTIQLLAQSFQLDSPRSLKHLVEAWAEELARVTDPEAMTQQLDERVQATTYVEVAYVVDLRGYTVAWTRHRQAAGAGLAGVERAREVDMRQRPWYRGVERSGRSILTPPYRSFQSAEICFTAAAPMRDAKGDFAGVLGIDVNVVGWTRI